MKANVGWVIIYQPGQEALVHEIHELHPGVGGVAWWGWTTIKEAKRFLRASKRNTDYQTVVIKQGGAIIISVFPKQWDFEETAKGFDRWCEENIFKTNMGGFNAN